MTMMMKFVQPGPCDDNVENWVSEPSDPNLCPGWLEYSHPLLLNTDDTYNLENQGNEVSRGGKQKVSQIWQHLIYLGNV